MKCARSIAGECLANDCDRPGRREAALCPKERPRPEVRCSTGAAPALPGKRRNARLPLSSNTCLPWHLDDSSVFCGMVACGSRGFMNRLLILGILIISTAPLFAQAQ